MSKYVVVVESPAKSKTIKKYLGKDFQVLASYGHVRDLRPKEGAVQTDNDFTMIYEPIERNLKHVAAIKKALSKAKALYLATDPDREGEAIAWHLCELLKSEGILDGKDVFRVAFNQITKKAVQEAVEHPRTINMALVNAQQARRALDYLVGFNLSPLLWKKIKRGLSAGRVQSPALKMIAEREEAIRAFKTEEYWTIHGSCEAELSFPTKLVAYQGEKLKQFSITNEKDAKDCVKKVTKAANGELQVSAVTKKERKRQPAPPFITSTLQQEASRKLGFGAQKTMMIAQQLYEGVELEGGEAEGLITYMRTDSVSLAAEAVAEIRDFIRERFGDLSLPDAPRVFKTKSKNAQEAHEAIRPISERRTPEDMQRFLSPDQLKLYTLIWKRTLACQMLHATINTVSIDLAAEDHIFRAVGSTIVSPGFLKVYEEGKDDQTDKDAKDADDESIQLPPLEKGQVVKLLDVKGNQHFTEPPPRFSEASLVKMLEEHGIGRPSTYASIISTLKQREYVVLDKKRFIPTDVGEVVNKFLTRFFSKYVDYTFTAELEDELDAVSRAEMEWIPLMETFWSSFKPRVDEIEETVSRKDVTQEETNESCPTCNAPLVIRLGKRGRFVGCSAYPDCSYTRNMNDDGQSDEPEVVADRECPSCNKALVVKEGRYGKFIGCSGYPECRHMEPLNKPEDTGVGCPKCKQGSLLKRKSRYGKIFFSCGRYPECDYAVWNDPVNEPCPDCNWPLLTIKVTKRKGREKVCPEKECKFAVAFPEEE